MDQQGCKDTSVGRKLSPVLSQHGGSEVPVLLHHCQWSHLSVQSDPATELEQKEEALSEAM